jgi:hypothetical protein
MKQVLSRILVADLALGLAVGASMMLAGCAASSDDTGIRVGDETLKQLEAGVTTEAWLLAILGPPTSASEVEGVENTRVYRYATGEAASGIATWFTGSSMKNTAVTYFIITDGIVTRFWADRAAEYTLLGKPVETPGGEKESE